jgi:hypothetical protein
MALIATMLVVLVIIAAPAREVRRATRQSPSDATSTAPGRHPLRYRVWAGMGLWIGATAAAVALEVYARWSGQDAAALSLIGFVLAFAWALFDPDRR